MRTGSVASVTLQSAPIRQATAQEIARVVGKNGVIRLTSPADYATGAHRFVIDALGKRVANVAQQTVDGVTTTIIKVN